MPFDLNMNHPLTPIRAVLESKSPNILLTTLDYAEAQIRSSFSEHLPEEKVRQFFQAYKEGTWDQVQALRHELLHDLAQLFKSPLFFPAPSQFAQSVWNVIARIPLGELTTYGAIARALNPTRPPSAQAVGTAVGRNPLPVLVPCHRVVTSQGRLGLYAYGSQAKFMLLSYEGIEFNAPSRSRRAEDDDVIFENLRIDNPTYMQL